MILLLIKIIFPIITGILFYIFLFLGMNARVISQNSTAGLLSIALGAVLVYAIVFGMINNPEDNFTFGYFGFRFARVFLAITLPILSIVYRMYSPSTTVAAPESLLQKENITFATDAKRYPEVKYGVFVKGYDTINRFVHEGFDFETIKTIQGEKTYKIKWLDSTSYCRVDPRNSLILEIVNLGNFANGTYQMYTKPAGSHEMRSERIQTVYKIN